MERVDDAVRERGPPLEDWHMIMLRASWRRVPRPRSTTTSAARSICRPLSTASVAEQLRSAEKQLGALPDAADASAKYDEQQFSAATGLQTRVVDIFGAIPDPALQLVTARQLAVLHGLLGNYVEEAKQRRAVVEAAAALPSPAAASSATVAAQYELSVSALRAGDLETASWAASAAREAVVEREGDGAATAVCEGWAATVTAAAGGTVVAIERLNAAIQTAPASLTAELQLLLGNVHRCSGCNASAATAFESTVEAAGIRVEDPDVLLSGLCGVVARVKLGEANMLHVESEAKKMIRGTRNANSEDVATKEQLDEVLNCEF